MTSAETIEQIISDPITHYPSATVACFDPTTGDLPRRELSERTISYLERLAEAGAGALLIAASTGHGHLRTVQELEVWYGLAAAVGPGGPEAEKIKQWLPDFQALPAPESAPLLTALL